VSVSARRRSHLGAPYTLPQRVLIGRRAGPWHGERPPGRLEDKGLLSVHRVPTTDSGSWSLSPSVASRVIPKRCLACWPRQRWRVNQLVLTQNIS